MFCCCLIVLAVITLLVVYFFKKIYAVFYNIPEVPKVDENYWWGAGAPNDKEDTSIVPFKINVTDEELADLKERLLKTRPITPPLEGIQHQYGINPRLLNEIKNFWLTKYNWRDRESYLNQYPHYKTKIQGLNIHFVHVKPTTTDGLKVVPILLLHGWPSSFREFYEVIPSFIKPNAGRGFVFEVIAASLPGYAFSDGAAKPGMDHIQSAVILKNLMKRLGFERWYVQGGDWGSCIAQSMTLLYPNHILGLHFNLNIVYTPLQLVKAALGYIGPSCLTKNYNLMKIPMTKILKLFLNETGYLHLQSTRPDSIGVAFSDSPLGLASYMIEKFMVGTNIRYLTRDDSGFFQKFDYNTLLDSIMIYWITNSMTTSCRLYKELFSNYPAVYSTLKNPIKVPCAYTQFKHEITYVTETILQDAFPLLLQYNEHDVGGHFAVLEEPILFANDVWSAVEKFENYHRK